MDINSGYSHQFHFIGGGLSDSNVAIQVRQDAQDNVLISLIFVVIIIIIKFSSKQNS